MPCARHAHKARRRWAWGGTFPARLAPSTPRRQRAWGRDSPGMLCGAPPPARFESCLSRLGGGCGDAIMGAPALPQIWQLYLKNYRIATFKNWPFLEDCACTPERMAEAGFIHCPTENEPDLAQCFFCFKELEGWEPDDNPIEEHRKHSPGCAFLTVKKQMEELTVSEFLKLDRQRAKNKIAKETNNKQKEFEETAKTTRQSIEQLAA